MSQSQPTPMFSVVICTYNRAELLRRAVGTVLAQTYEDFELVVVDDGSTDDTSQVMVALSSPRLRYVRQENSGSNVARNTGVANSSGKYVVFLDDDDFARSMWLESLSRALHDDCAVVCCGELIAGDHGPPRGSKLPGPLGPAFADCSGLFLAGTFAVRRDVFEAVGGFLPGLPRLQHTEFALRLLPFCAARGWVVRTVDEALVQIHFHGPRGGRHQLEDLLTATEYILEHHGRQLARSPSMLAQYAAVAGVAAAQTGDYRSARRHFRRAVRTRPRDSKQWLRLALASVPPAGRRVWGRHGRRLASARQA